MRGRLAGLSAGLGILLGCGPSLAADPPQMTASLPIERIIATLRCNLDQAIAATAQANMRLTVTAVDLHLSALQSRSGKSAEAAVEVPAVAAGVDARALETTEAGNAPPVSTHAVDIHFVPFGESPPGRACPTDIGLLSVVRSAIAALQASEGGTDRLVVDFAAEFAISRSQDDKIEFLFLDRDRELRHLAVHKLKIDLQLDRT
jgi:hypothetical protein